MTAPQFGNAYSEGFQRTVSFLSAKGLAPAEAQDVAQAAWARGWERKSQLRDQAKLSTWINSIAFNLLRNRFRRAQHHTELPELPDDRHCPSGVRKDLDFFLSRCEPLDAAILWMRYAEGRTSIEIAHRLRMKPATLRVRILRAKARLRRGMQVKHESRSCLQEPQSAAGSPSRNGMPTPVLSPASHSARRSCTTF